MIFTLDAPEPVVGLTFDQTTGELLALGAAGNLATVDLDTQAVVAEVQLEDRSGFLTLGVRPDGLVVASGWAHAVLVDRVNGPVGAPLFHGANGLRIRDDGTVVAVSGTRHDIFDDFSLG